VRRPDLPRPFRMWLYPVPAILAIFGFVYILLARKDFLKEIRYSFAILIIGILLYITRAWRYHDWPFRAALPAPAEIKAS
jgi:hypothetical protein